MAKLKVAFDCDDTLMRMGPDGRDIPNYDVIDLLRWFQRHGHIIYVWSGGGIDYAKRIVAAMGLDDPVNPISVIAKGSMLVDIAVDDGGFRDGAEKVVAQELRSARVTLHV